MKLFKGFSSKRKENARNKRDTDFYETRRNLPPFLTPPKFDCVNRLPPPVLERIFTYVCPHSRDESYETCEQSALDETCMLCDSRDLAHCTAVSRRWRKLASNILYHSIRIDAVHYCEREEILSEKRKNRSFFNSNAEPEDAAQQRLRLLCRTLRENQRLGLTVQVLKTPFMTRETCKTDLTKTVAVLHNLRYVDLPDGFFTDDPSCQTMRAEVQARCPEIRKMTYNHGAEKSLQLLTSRTIWSNMEVLELSKLVLNPQVLRYVIGSLPNLRALKISDIDVNDSLLVPDQNFPPVPPLVELILERTPYISPQGLSAYLSLRSAAEALRTISITNCNFPTSSLHLLLSAAYALENFSIIESVTAPFSASQSVPPLASTTLKTLHYEITDQSSINSFNSASTSHYSYLTASLLGNGLPALMAVYVRDPSFPDSLLDFSPPRPGYMSDFSNPSPNPTNHLSPHQTVPNIRLSSNNPFAGTAYDNGAGFGNGRNDEIPKHELEVYTKGDEETEWSFAHADTDPHRTGLGPVPMTALRPVSAYGLAAGAGTISPTWTGGFSERSGVRKSVMIGNGFGGFLPVPDAGGNGRPGSSKSNKSFDRPSSSSGNAKRSTGYDIWR